MDVLNKYAAGRELLQVLKALDEAARSRAIACVAKLLVEAGKDVGSEDKENTKPAALEPTEQVLCVVPEINLVNPRGKFSLSVCQNSLLFNSAKTSFSISRDSIRAVAVIDQIPKDTKSRVLMFIALKPGARVLAGKQHLDAVLIQTLADTEISVPIVGEEEPAAGPAAVVLCQLLGMVGVSDFLSSDPDCFTTHSGHCAIAAHHKVNAGFLFPMPGCFCFVERPCLYINHEHISWIELQRIDRPTTTFDLVIHLVKGSGPAVELSQVDRRELDRFRAYLTKHKIKTSAEEAAADTSSRGTGKSGGSGKPGEAGGDEDTSDDPDEDEDFRPDASDSVQQGSGSDDDGEGSVSVSMEDEDDGGHDDEGEEEVQGASKQAAAKKRKAPAADTAESEDIGDDSDDDEDDEEDEYESEGSDEGEEQEEEEQPSNKKARAA